MVIQLETKLVDKLKNPERLSLNEKEAIKLIKKYYYHTSKYYQDYIDGENTELHILGNITKRNIHKYHFELISHLAQHLIGNGFYQLIFKLIFEDVYNRKMSDDEYINYNRDNHKYKKNKGLESDHNKSKGNINYIIENIKDRIINIKYFKKDDHDSSLKYIIEKYLRNVIIYWYF